MGFDLMKNFDSPYFSKSITEFWRRWHISLSTWFRDYVYIPLGGSRNGKYRTYANLFIVFLVSGLWHGAAMTFVIWGAIHGVFIVVEKALTKFRMAIFKQYKALNYLIALPFTFFIVCFAWIFFRANSFGDAMLIINNTLQIKDTQNIFNLGLKQTEFKLLFVMILLLLVFEMIHKRFSALIVLNKLYLPLRWIFYLTIVFCILIFGIYGENTVKEFIYFQF
jgi:D-alanyl-lipoteichoic acid acyltransferase DltB (MBOAT superfamily)